MDHKYYISQSKFNHRLSNRIEKKSQGKFTLNLILFFTIQAGYGQVLKSCMKKVGFFLLLFFRNISKTAEMILIKKIGQNHGIPVYKKSLIRDPRKNYIFRDNNCFVKMSVSYSVRYQFL